MGGCLASTMCLFSSTHPSISLVFTYLYNLHPSSEPICLIMCPLNVRKKVWLIPTPSTMAV